MTDWEDDEKRINKEHCTEHLDECLVFSDPEEAHGDECRLAEYERRYQVRKASGVPVACIMSSREFKWIEQRSRTDGW